MYDLSGYRICTVASTVYFGFLQRFINSLIDNGITYSDILVGNAGLEKEEVNWIIKRGLHNLYFVNTAKISPKSTIATNQNTWVEFGKAWANAITTSFNDDPSKPLLMIDADTSIISNDFSLLDREADITITTRRARPYQHPDHVRDNQYVNSGVVFFHKPTQCDWLLYELLYRIPLEAASTMHGAQGCFHRAILNVESQSDLYVQRLHCRYYNCFHPEWKNPRTSVLHFRGDGTLNEEQRVARMMGGETVGKS